MVSGLGSLVLISCTEEVVIKALFWKRGNLLGDRSYKVKKAIAAIINCP